MTLNQNINENLSIVLTIPIIRHTVRIHDSRTKTQNISFSHYKKSNLFKQTKSFIDMKHQQDFQPKYVFSCAKTKAQNLSSLTQITMANHNLQLKNQFN
jgi:hypothetical protein